VRHVLPGKSCAILGTARAYDLGVVVTSGAV
jgi:hypothetical protein